MLGNREFDECEEAELAGRKTPDTTHVKWFVVIWLSENYFGYGHLKAQ